MAISISPITTENYGEIFTLQRAAFVDEAKLYGTPDVPSLNENFDELVARLEKSQSWIAVDQNRIVGAVSLRSYRGAPDVERLMVAPDRRGESIATKLLTTLELSASESGHMTIQLIVGDAAIKNQEIYTHLGWHRTDTFHLAGYPHVVLHTMIKTLGYSVSAPIRMDNV